MFVFAQYKAIKERIGTTEPVFRFLGQYLKGKDNTSYRVPAVYIETPKNNDLVFYGKKIMAAKNAIFKIHYISHAPFKNHDNDVQDSALAAHEARVKAIDRLIRNFEYKDNNGRLLMQQLMPVKGNATNLLGTNIYSVMSYKTEVYNYQ